MTQRQTKNIQATLFAVNESAAEACTSKCSPAVADARLLSDEQSHDAKTKQEYDACYSKCVAQETKEVVEEREKVSHVLCTPLYFIPVDTWKVVAQG